MEIGPAKQFDPQMYPVFRTHSKSTHSLYSTFYMSRLVQVGEPHFVIWAPEAFDYGNNVFFLSNPPFFWVFQYKGSFYFIPNSLIFFLSFLACLFVDFFSYQS